MDIYCAKEIEKKTVAKNIYFFSESYRCTQNQQNQCSKHFGMTTLQR